MRTKVSEEQKFATIWLTNEDQQNEAIIAAVSALTKGWRSKGYLPVVFYSGHGDLYENTAALLLHNREGAALHAMERREAIAATQTKETAVRGRSLHVDTAK